MSFKLALRNARKSFKDYTIYFLTLTFGACVFYVFNSLDSQQAMLKLSETQSDIIQELITLLSYVSIFIAIILGLLIVYANFFLIRRRKKEFGIYSLLGMPKRQVATILSIETVMISLISLAAGLISGIFISQGLSFITARLFRADLTNFRFVFSQAAATKTILYFGVMFLLVLACNIFAVSRQKTIKLLYGGRKNQRQWIHHSWIYVLIFLLSLACIGTGYYLVLHHNILGPNNQLGIAIALGSIGTVLFFLSLSGFLLKVVQSIKRIYYRGLNMFTMRQLSSSVNTAFLSISLICLMLFFTIVVLSAGLGVSQVFNESLEHGTPYDMDVFVQDIDPSLEDFPPQGKFYPASAYLRQQLPEEFNAYVKEYVDLAVYKSDDLPINIFETSNGKIGSALDQFNRVPPLQFIRQSDFNQLLRLQGKDAISLSGDEAILMSDMEQLAPMYQSYLKEHDTVDIHGRQLRIQGRKLQTFPLDNSPIPMNSGTLIVPDDVVDGMDIATYSIKINLNEGKNEEEFASIITNRFGYESEVSTERPVMLGLSRNRVYEQSVGLSAIFTFLAIYIGIIFLITSAAILALKQLSDASDNMNRYQLLEKIGVDRSMINHAIFTQVAIYFLIPLVVALIHSIVGLKVTQNLVEMFGGYNITTNLLQVTLLFVIVYGGYFIATYLGCKGMNSARSK